MRSSSWWSAGLATMPSTLSSTGLVFSGPALFDGSSFSGTELVIVVVGGHRLERRARFIGVVLTRHSDNRRLQRHGAVSGTSGGGAAPTSFVSPAPTMAAVPSVSAPFLMNSRRRKYSTSGVISEQAAPAQPSSA